MTYVLALATQHPEEMLKDRNLIAPKVTEGM
jgi:hypothetical protein